VGLAARREGEAELGVDLEKDAPLRIDIGRRVLTETRPGRSIACRRQAAERGAAAAVVQGIDLQSGRSLRARYVGFQEATATPSPDGRAGVALDLIQDEGPFNAEVTGGRVRKTVRRRSSSPRRACSPGRKRRCPRRRGCPRPSKRRRISFTALGLAFPPVSFITAPTKKPSSLASPPLKRADLGGVGADHLAAGLLEEAAVRDLGDGLALDDLSGAAALLPHAAEDLLAQLAREGPLLDELDQLGQGVRRDGRRGELARDRRRGPAPR
jgi:hypothetical protein